MHACCLVSNQVGNGGRVSTLYHFQADYLLPSYLHGHWQFLLKDIHSSPRISVGPKKNRRLQPGTTPAALLS